MNPDLILVRPALWSRLLRLGANVDQAMTMARIPASGRVDTARYFAFWEAVTTASPADIGLRYAAETTVHEYDLSLLAALYSPDVRSVFDKLSRYKRLCGPQDLSLAFSAKEVAVSTVWLNASMPPPSRLVDMMFATLLLLLQRGSGQVITPKRLELTRGREDELMLMQHFGCPLMLHAKRDAIIFDNGILETPFITHNADLLGVLLPSLDQQVASIRGDSFPDQVRQAVARLSPDECRANAPAQGKSRVRFPPVRARYSAVSKRMEQATSRCWTMCAMTRRCVFCAQRALSLPRLLFCLGSRN